MARIVLAYPSEDWAPTFSTRFFDFRLGNHLTLRRKAQLLQQPDRSPPLSQGEHGPQLIHRRRVGSKGALDQSASRRGKMHDACAAVARIVAALDEAASLQPVDRDRHRSAGQQHRFANIVHRSRSFVQQHLKHGEIGHPEAERNDVARGVIANGVVSLPQDQPQVDAAVALPRGVLAGRLNLFSIS